MREVIEKIKARLKQFREWQMTPYAEQPYSDYEQHACLNCGESYNGRFCPRCGQTAGTRRLTLRNALSNFMDVWGLGGRSLPRLLLHLMLRPGYMMRDYIYGHRQPYFPIFKTLFLLVVFYLLICAVHPDINYVEDPQPDGQTYVEQAMALHKDLNKKNVVKGGIETTQQLKSDDARVRYLSAIEQWFNDSNVASIIVVQIVTCIAARIGFRRSPRMKTLTITEHFYIQIMVAAQLMFIAILYLLATETYYVDEAFPLPDWLCVVITYLDYKQLFGFSHTETLLRVILTDIIQMLIIAIGISLIYLSIVTILYIF